MTDQNAIVQPAAPSWRYKLGIALFCCIPAIWILVPIATSAGVSAAKVAALTGFILVFNKVVLLLVIAVMGKSGFQQLKGSIFGVFKLSSDTEISSARHAVGILMFCLPLITSAAEPYIDTLWPSLRPNIWQLQLLGDVMLVASFFVLGGNFWDKFRALFIRNARVVTGP